MIRPSVICSCPEQNISTGAGTESMKFVTGFQVIAVFPKDSPSHNKNLPVGKSTELTATIGKGTIPDHMPNCAGFPALEFEKVTETGLEFAVLVLKSHAEAVMECAPFAKFAVFNVKINGALLRVVPTGTPSTWSSTAATPVPASDALTVTETGPEAVPPVGLAILLVGGVVLGGGLPAARKATI